MKPSRLKSRKGAALIEAALLLPILLFLILNMVNLGIYIFAWITVNNAARAAAEYSAYNGAAVNLPAQPTFAQIQTLVNADVSSLPNYAAGTNPTMRVCSNTNGTQSCNAACADCTTPADPEPALYTVNYVDIEYSFTPVFRFSPALGISLTIPPTVIHRQAVMRRMR